MTQRLLQALGIVFVVGALATALVGVAVVKDRVRVVISADETSVGPDPMALLRDDVRGLTQDVSEFRSGLASGFERFGAALEERAAARHAEALGWRQEFADLRRQVHDLARANAALYEQVRELARLTAIASEAMALAAAEPAAGPEVPPVAPLAAAPEAAREPEPARAETQPAAVKTTGFLSFSLPASEFRFDEPRDYALVPDLCRVGFDAKSTLHDFSGVTSNVKGSFRVDFDDPEGACSGEIVAAAGTLKTGVEGRDAKMLEHLDVKSFPEIKFKIERFRPSEGGVDVAKMTAKGEVSGTMSIRGVERPLTIPVAVEVDPQRRVVVKGEVPLKLSDYGVPVPSQLGVINMEDEVKIWIALRARMQKAGGK